MSIDRNYTHTCYELINGQYYYYPDRKNMVYTIRTSNVPRQTVVNVPVTRTVQRSSSCNGRIALIIACIVFGLLFIAAVAIGTAILVTEIISKETTTHTTTTTTTTATTTDATSAVQMGVQNYAVLLDADGYHGVQHVRYYQAINTSTSLRLAYPIVYLSEATFSGTYTNEAWYALHGGCGNTNGVASCKAVCKSLSRSYIGVSSSCGTEYPGAVNSYVTPDRAVYTSADTIDTPWVDYGTASTCTNPMIYCECSL